MLLFCSSFLFLTNVATTLYQQYYFYSFLFFMLTLTSLQYWNPTPVTKRIDQSVVSAVVVWGGWVLYSKLPANGCLVGLVVGAFLTTGYLYTYGLCTQQYCFDKNHGDKYHCLLHGLSSMGHHIITFL